MNAYGAAFARQDADAAAALFTDDAIYEWGPFGDLLRGPDEIRAKWIEAADASTATFDYELIAVTDEVGVARWVATHTYPDKLLRYDGIFAVKLDDSRWAASFASGGTSRRRGCRGPARAGPLRRFSSGRASCPVDRPPNQR